MAADQIVPDVNAESTVRPVETSTATRVRQLHNSQSGRHGRFSLPDVPQRAFTEHVTLSMLKSAAVVHRERYRSTHAADDDTWWSENSLRNLWTVFGPYIDAAHALFPDAFDHMLAAAENGLVTEDIVCNAFAAAHA